LKARLVLIGLGLFALFGAPALGHLFEITDVLIVVQAHDVYTIDVRLDADALALGVSPSTDSAQNVDELLGLSPARFEAAVERARDTIRRRIRLRLDGEALRPRVSFPEMNTPFADEAEVPTVLGVVARLTGRLPAGASELTFGLSRAFGPARVTILEQETLQGASYTLGAGEDTPVHRLGEPSLPARRGTVAMDYLVLGFEHIVPKGLDHVLFVLGLFLLSVRLRPLIWQVTAFTLAHSVTLGLSMAGVISLPASIVEPLIALSIAYVAFENLWTKEMKPWRPVLVFGFGLLHGLGFAGVLRELGLPAGEFAAGLIAFNVGVELGQLSVILLALATIGWFRTRPWYRSWIVLPLSIGIAIVGLIWTVQRVL
jgi:hypothetical protein